MSESAVLLTVPARSRYVRVARLTAATIAAEAELDVDDVEDLRVAVNEMFALLVEDAESDTDVVELRYAVRDGAIEVRGSRTLSTTEQAPEPDDLALEILRVIVDEHEFVVEAGERRFRLVKRTATR